MREEEEVLFSKDELEFWKLLKDYAKHEDGLINNRLTWAMGVSSALFVSVGVLFSNKEDIAKVKILVPGTILQESNAFDWLILLVGSVGLLTTISCAFGVYAAMTALKALGGRWASFAGQEDRKSRLNLLPSILGGGHEASFRWPVFRAVLAPHRMGLIYPHMILISFSSAWFVILLWVACQFNVVKYYLAASTIFGLFVAVALILGSRWGRPTKGA